MTEEHTPTPWEIRAGSYSGIEHTEIATVYNVERMPTEDGLGVEYCTIIGKASDHTSISDYHKECTANAAFIVRAVNSHEQLVSALKEARRHVSANLICIHGHDDFGELRRIDAILKSAGESHE